MNNKRFEILHHAADLKLKIFAKTQKELFENAMIGMFEAAESVAKERSKATEREIEIKSQDLPSLLVDFLSEVLYLSEVNNELYNEIEFEEFKETELKGKIRGSECKERTLMIKGVTYHSLEILKVKDGLWSAIILFDI